MNKFAIFRNRSFSLLILGQSVSNIGTGMGMAASAWAIYELTNSPIQIGVLALFRTLPFITLSLLGGTMADRLDRRKVLIVTQLSLSAANGVLAAAFLGGWASPGLMYAVALVVGVVGAFDQPSMQTAIPGLVPSRDLLQALSIGTLSRHIGNILGPPIGGLLIATIGVGAAFAVDAMSFLGVVTVLSLIRWPSRMPATGRRVLSSIVDGLNFARQRPIVISLLSLDLTATFFAQPAALLPVFARDVLVIGPEGYGILGGAFSAGAIVGGVLMSYFGARVAPSLRSVVTACACFGAFGIAFGLSRNVALSFGALVLMGLADVISETLRSTMLQLSIRDEMRGRMTALSAIFFRGGPNLGQLRAGTFADLFGPTFAMVSGSMICIAGVLAIGRWTSIVLSREEAPIAGSGAPSGAASIT